MSTDPSLRAPALAAFAAPVAGYGILLGSWLIPATSAGLLGALVAGAVALAVSVVLVATIPVRAIADLVESRLRPTLPSGRFHGAASDISVSLGASGHLLIQESPSFDVAGLPTSRRDVVVVSTGAFDVLTRREVVALASARLAALREPWCRAATLGTLAWWSLRFVLPFGLLGFVFGAPALGIAAAALLPLVFVLGDRIVWLRDRCVDLAAIERAVDPGGLAGAVRRVSGLGRRVDDHAADPSSPVAPGWLHPPRLAGGAMTTNAGFDGARRRHIISCLRLLEAADRQVGMAIVLDSEPSTGRTLRRQWAQVGRPVTPV